MASAHEYQITIFSPEGKLHQVEYAFKAIKLSGLTSIGVRGANSVVVVTEKRVGDRMVDPESVTNIFRITPHVGCLVTGRESDGRAWVSRLRQESFEYLQQNGHQIPVDVLAMRAADVVQLYTQKSFMRAYAVELMLFSVDKLLGPQLFKVDPAGHYFGYHGVTSGVKEQEAANFLEKEYKQKNGFSKLNSDETVRLAIEGLQNTIGQDFKSNDIEVAIVDAQNFTFKKLTPEQIEAHLLVIQRFD
jgi:20S proteasome subunit alpha 1